MKFFKPIHRRRILTAIAALALMLAVLMPVVGTLAENNGGAPTIGSAVNVAEHMNVSVANTACDYQSTKTVPFTGSATAVFSNISYTGTDYSYSGEVQVDSDSSSYGSIRFIAATGTMKSNGEAAQVEVCIRPNLDSQAVIFAVSGYTETSVKVGSLGSVSGGFAMEFGKSYTYTVTLAGNNLSFWVNDAEVFSQVDLSEMLNDIAPYAGAKSQNCTGSIRNICIWGDVEITFYDFDPATDTNVAPLLNPSGTFTSELSSRYIFKGLSFPKNSYSMTANGSYVDNPDRDYEGLRLVVASAKNVLTDEEVYIEVNVRGGTGVHIWARREAGGETRLLSDYTKTVNTPGTVNGYTVSYREGQFWFYKDGVLIFDGFDIASSGEGGYYDIQPLPGLSFEVCDGTFSNLCLWGDGVQVSGAFPEMPAGNGNYADTMKATRLRSTDTEYKNGTLRTLKASTDTVAFTNVPFTQDDTYVYSFDLNVTGTSGDEGWKGVRPVIRANEDYTDCYYLLLTSDSMIVTHNGTSVQSTPLKRTFGRTYHFGMVVSPDSVSIWVDGILFLENVPLEEPLPANTGIKFEYAEAVVSDIRLYYATETPYVAPEGDPTIPPFTSDMYNGAQYMTVKNGSTDYSYQDYQLTHTAATATSSTYTFSNIPFTRENAAYTYRTKVRMNSEFTETWRGPRLKFRVSDMGSYYIAFMQDSIKLLRDNNYSLATYKVDILVGATYDVAIYSDEDTVTVWLNGECIFNRLDMSSTEGKTRAACGVIFEICDATIWDLQLYGEDIVFNEDTFDPVLRANKYFNMSTVPARPTGNINYFANVQISEATDTTVSSVYEDGLYQNEFIDADGKVYFVDPAGSYNLNGLKNSDTYVISYTVSTDAVSTEQKDPAMWFVYKLSTFPAVTTDYVVRFGILEDSVQLQALRSGTAVKAYSVPFERVLGREYRVDILVGSDWSKVWVDGKLMVTAYDLPTYNNAFDLQVSYAAAKVRDIQVYNVEPDNAVLLEAVESPSAVRSGNTVKTVASYDIPTVGVSLVLAVAAGIVGGLLLIAAVVFTVFLIRKKVRGNSASKEEIIQ